MAGHGSWRDFIRRRRTAAGHDGLWFWKSARTYAKADELWLAWMLYGEADELLRPANFVTSTNLDRAAIGAEGVGTAGAAERYQPE